MSTPDTATPPRRPHLTLVTDTPAPQPASEAGDAVVLHLPAMWQGPAPRLAAVPNPPHAPAATSEDGPGPATRLQRQVGTNVALAGYTAALTAMGLLTAFGVFTPAAAAVFPLPGHSPEAATDHDDTAIPGKAPVNRAGEHHTAGRSSATDAGLAGDWNPRITAATASYVVLSRPSGKHRKPAGRHRRPAAIVEDTDRRPGRKSRPRHARPGDLYRHAQPGPGKHRRTEAGTGCAEFV